MPYNPGSAYPRQTTWTPHSHPNGLGIVKAVNAPQIGTAPKVRGTANFAGYGSPYAKNHPIGQLNNALATEAMAPFQQRGFLDQVGAQAREHNGRAQNRRKTTAPVNPAAVDNKAQAENTMERMAASVIASPSAGTSTASGLIIPPIDWQPGTNRRKP